MVTVNFICNVNTEEEPLNSQTNTAEKCNGGEKTKIFVNDEHDFFVMFSNSASQSR